MTRAGVQRRPPHRLFRPRLSQLRRRPRRLKRPAVSHRRHSPASGTNAGIGSRRKSSWTSPAGRRNRWMSTCNGPVRWPRGSALPLSGSGSGRPRPWWSAGSSRFRTKCTKTSPRRRVSRSYGAARAAARCSSSPGQHDHVLAVRAALVRRGPGHRGIVPSVRHVADRRAAWLRPRRRLLRSQRHRLQPWQDRRRGPSAGSRPSAPAPVRYSTT